MKSKFPTDRYFRQCVGIDVSKSKFTACLCMLSWGCPAQFTESIEFANTKTGFNQLVKWARREAEKGKPILFLMEPTGTYYEDLAYHLHKLSFTVYVIPSCRVHAFFKEEGIKTKTDSVDAYGLARWEAASPISRSGIHHAPHIVNCASSHGCKFISRISGQCLQTIRKPCRISMRRVPLPSNR